MGRGGRGDLRRLWLGSGEGMSAVGIAERELSRARVVERLARSLADHHWALQGPTTAASKWVADGGLSDLDLWVADESVGAMDELLIALGGVAVCSTTDPRRLRHRQYWMPTTFDDGANGPRLGSIVDVTVGDLRVGPVLLVPEYLVTVRFEMVRCDREVQWRLPVLSGVARVADLSLRPLLRGRVVDGARRRDAALELAALPAAQRAYLRGVVGHVVGDRRVDDVWRWLTDPAANVEMVNGLRAARRRMVSSTLAPRNVLSTLRQWATIVPSRRKGPAGLRHSGVVVAMVGTDGSGKSTTAERLASELRRAGFTVTNAYFGMARGNLPGLALLRRLAGGGDTSARPQPSATVVESRDASVTAVRPSLVHRAAAWVYVLDYLWRSVRLVRPAVRRGHVVICDRWVTDLRRHPAPGSSAARVAQWLVGAPDVFMLADAPVEEMVARKGERSVAESRAEQEGLRTAGHELDGRRARGGGTCSFVTFDTSSTNRATRGTRLLESVRLVVAAAHHHLPHI
jgi:thymidylate kinase